MQTLTPHLPGIFVAFGVLALGVFSPGPATLSIIATALEKGKTPAVFFASGVVSGSVFWGVLAAAGMATIISQFAILLVLLKIAGGLYLLYLAYKSFSIALSPTKNLQRNRVPEETTLRRFYLSGLFIHLTNPKAIFTWLAAISLGINQSSPPWVAIAIVIGGTVISICGNLFYALAFSTRSAEKIYRRISRFVHGALGVVFAFAGLKLLTSK